ncbi:alpha/beta fold hydrolase [Vibrio sp. V27_P1S3P104]|uniref:alpha/beta fold hydrolase n=1 Tax=unclassified Vibrio TaxID=2614977 RepID=UPI0013732439|nr:MULTISPECIES: alpha/beta fold hydrolase [unclassified Vibrio]NAW70206.1 alpha/beta fold hydrolase [Vibrio sp. V28_P6S34P95]NAX06444.1 alpha/beta fold hydrolase [Vibrio sp. V30_P3S12P165]NAX34343.1 alpha/beta fold hydrolase [Vibrio sp. V29_P1S30P107]NAX37848.1 alpha/beta fold hydrolase [Vibrio sp. V27_P1S3P104]NAX41673.1 alpha/beta fold hydrolase [Vibrio sp. V26_P1S5P106]
MSALLNYKLEGEGHTVVLIHGLFGNLSNLGLLARDLKIDHQVLSIDLRNHGQSFHSSQHNYALMARDVDQLLQHLGITQATIIGHSMGGKVAMKLADLAPDIIQQLIVLDMAPVAYHIRRHDHIFAGLDSVLEQKPASRSEVMALLAKHISQESVCQFLAKSLINQDSVMLWRFNLDAIKANYENILGWEPIAKNKTPALFIKGADSNYLTAEHQTAIQQQFYNAKAHVIAKTGHWLHAEKPIEVLRAIRKFIV